MKRFFYEFILPAIIVPIYLLLKFSWRIREFGPPAVLEEYIHKRKALILVHWHGDELAMVPYYSFRKLGVLASLSDDGALMARALALMGYTVFRGSSSRGGARGLIGLIRFAKNGGQTSLAVDGPKGPIYEVKPGIIDLARRTGLPVVPIRAFVDRAWFIPRAWNKSYLPKPFAKVNMVYGEPIVLPDDEAAACLAVKQGLEQIKV